MKMENNLIAEIFSLYSSNMCFLPFSTVLTESYFALHLRRMYLT